MHSTLADGRTAGTSAISARDRVPAASPAAAEMNSGTSAEKLGGLGEVGHQIVVEQPADDGMGTVGSSHEFHR